MSNEKMNIEPVSPLRPPFFTIITPSFNQGSFIKQTIESVLFQDFSSIEYIILDGGSTDETLSVLRSFGGCIQWRSEPDNGQAHAVNKGLQSARGEIIGWLNSDDIYYPGALRAVHEFFSASPGIDVLYGMVDHVDAAGNIIAPYPNEKWNYERLKEFCFISQPAVFFRKKIIDSFGLLDETLEYCMDYEYWLRIGARTRFYYLEQKLAATRLHEATKSLGCAVAAQNEILMMLRDKIGHIPNRWIISQAHEIVRSRGLTSITTCDKFRYAFELLKTSSRNSAALRNTQPLSLIADTFVYIIAMLIRRLRHWHSLKDKCLNK